jgi:hypothetical protein
LARSRSSISRGDNLERVCLPINGDGAAVGERRALSAARGIQEFMIGHREQSRAAVQRRETSRLCGIGVGTALSHLRRVGMEERAQIIRRRRSDHRVVIDQLVKAEPGWRPW